MKKKTKIILSLSLATILLSPLAGLMITGYAIGWGPFSCFRMLNKGNRAEYHLNNVEALENSPLEGKKVAFLGSSVTYGAASGGVSFADYIAKRNKLTYIKEAVSGTTLCDNGDTSYVARLKKMSTTSAYDLFIVQLSTNDAAKSYPLGTPQKNGTYDTSTVAGAIETIIDYIHDTWNCPVIFYTNCYFESENYSSMVNLLYEIQETKDIGILDLYSDKEFNTITKKERKLYLFDSIHPTQAGYLKWWTPYMENWIYGYAKANL